MSYSERVELYQQIEELRTRPLVTYITSSRQRAAGQMASDVVPEFARQLLAIPKSEKQVDILIVSNGGDPITAWHVVSMLRERFDKLSVLLPFTAYSAATLLALGADEIVMHPLSNLGPVDPQLTYTRPMPGDESRQITSNFGAQDLINYFDFIREDVGISDQEELERAFELLCKDVGAVPVGVAKRSTQLSLSMGEKLLSLHMKDRNEARTIAESLAKSFHHHGYAVGRTEAEQIGLPITKPSEELETLIWQVWQDAEEEMLCCHPFNPVELVLEDAQLAALLDPVPQVQLPANLPPQVLQQALNNILQQIQVVSVKSVEYELFQATLESIRCRSEFRTKGRINAIRKPDLQIAISITPTSQRWAFESNPADADEDD